MTTSVKIIGANAFANAALTNIFISTSITFIDEVDSLLFSQKSVSIFNS